MEQKQKLYEDILKMGIPKETAKKALQVLFEWDEATKPKPPPAKPPGNGEFLLAAEVYMMYPMMRQEDIKKLWPFEWENFKPSDRVSDLKKATSLIANEIEILQGGNQTLKIWTKEQ